MRHAAAKRVTDSDRRERGAQRRLAGRPNTEGRHQPEPYEASRILLEPVVNTSLCHSPTSSPPDDIIVTALSKILLPVKIFLVEAVT